MSADWGGTSPRRRRSPWSCSWSRSASSWRSGSSPRWRSRDRRAVARHGLTAGVYSLIGFEVSPHGHRPADHPGLLPVRHRRRLRQGRREHQGLAVPLDLLGGREPRGQPDPDALDQHLGHRAAAGRRPAVRRRRAARRRHAQGPGAGAVRRPGRGRILSIFLATPVLASSRSASPSMQALGKRVLARRAAEARPRRPGRRAARRPVPGGPAARPAPPAGRGRGRRATRGAPAAARRRRAGRGAARRRRPAGSGRDAAAGPRPQRPGQKRGGGRPARSAGEPAPASRPVDEFIASIAVDVPDFPEPGVLFRDLTPLFADGPRSAGWSTR